MKKSRQLSPTKTNQKEGSQSNPYESLPERYQVAIEMKIEAYRYRYIAKTLKVKESTVKDWFVRGGKCEAGYNWRIKEWKEETERLFTTIREEIKSGAVDAIVTLKKKARKGNVVAAKDLLDRAGFGAVLKIKQETPTTVHITVIRPGKKRKGASHGRKQPQHSA